MQESDIQDAANAELNEEQLSALRESIQRKGNNSYYYAHGAKIDGPQWDGKEEPRLLAKQVVSSGKQRAEAFSSYAWADEEKSVKLYIDFPNANDISDDAIRIETPSADAVTFIVITADKDYKLVLDTLNASIDSATFRKKTDKFVVSLKKSVEASWFSLKKSK